MEEIGLKILDRSTNSKRKESDLEQDPVLEFNPYTRPDIWQSAQHTSQSIRTGLNDKVMKMNPVYDTFHTNKHLDFYKQALVNTKNVTHIVPFRHSNNIKGNAMLDLRPKTKKTYPKTTDKQLRIAYFSNKQTYNLLDKSDEFEMLNFNRAGSFDMEMARNTNMTQIKVHRVNTNKKSKKNLKQNVGNKFSSKIRDTLASAGSQNRSGTGSNFYHNQKKDFDDPTPVNREKINKVNDDMKK